MRTREFFIVLALGAVIGAAGVLAVVPDARLADLFGPDSFLLTFSDQLSSMGYAARGIFIGFMWTIFGIAIARLWGIVAGTTRSIARGDTH